MTSEHGKNERIQYVIATSVCVTLASFAFLVAVITLMSGMPDTTSRAVSTAHCDTMSETSTSNVIDATHTYQLTCPRTDSNLSKGLELPKSNGSTIITK